MKNFFATFFAILAAVAVIGIGCFIVVKNDRSRKARHATEDMHRQMDKSEQETMQTFRDMIARDERLLQTGVKGTEYWSSEDDAKARKASIRDSKRSLIELLELTAKRRPLTADERKELDQLKASLQNN